MARKREEAVYIISVAAELAGVHPQTLRIYERKGLIEPYRTPGGTRRYSDADLARLNAIQKLTDAGVNLEGVRRILQMEELLSRLERQIDSLREGLDDAKREARKNLSQLPDILRPSLEELLGSGD